MRQSRSPSSQTHGVQSLFVQHTGPLRGFIQTMLPDSSGVDDVLQETFLTVSEKAADFRPDGNFLAWAIGIAKRKAFEYLRARRGAPQPLSLDVLEALASCYPIEDQTQLDHRVSLLAKCIDSLSPRIRSLIELRYVHDHKPSEVAQRVGWSPQAVYVALSRARTTLRRCLEDQLSDLEPEVR